MTTKKINDNRFEFNCLWGALVFSIVMNIFHWGSDNTPYKLSQRIDTVERRPISSNIQNIIQDSGWKKEIMPSCLIGNKTPSIHRKT